MFDFAVTQYRRRRPTGRVFTSWVVSCLLHFMLVMLLIEFPQLLRGGMYHGFRPIPLVRGLLAPDKDDDDGNWRTVAVLRTSEPMMMPSQATLRQYLQGLNKKESDGGVPPIQVRWGDEEKAPINESAIPVPRVSEKPEPPKPSPPAGDIATADSSSTPGAQTAMEQVSDVSLSDASKKNGEISLFQTAPAPKDEVASKSAPGKIPDKIEPPSNIADAAPEQQNRAMPDTIKVFENEQKAIRSEGSGLFDTKGFPLGDYANLIVERIKGKWFIPSNLRDAQGHTTVVFFIDKNGRFTDARIVMSSGHNSLDLAALNAVIESNPFPPLPEGFPGEHIGAKFIFSYNEPQ